MRPTEPFRVIRVCPGGVRDQSAGTRPGEPRVPRRGDGHAPRIFRGPGDAWHSWKVSRGLSRPPGTGDTWCSKEVSRRLSRAPGSGDTWHSRKVFRGLTRPPGPGDTWET